MLRDGGATTQTPKHSLKQSDSEIKRKAKAFFFFQKNFWRFLFFKKEKEQKKGNLLSYNIKVVDSAASKIEALA